MAWGNGDKFAWWLYNSTHIKQQCSPPQYPFTHQIREIKLLLVHQNLCRMKMICLIQLLRPVSENFQLFENLSIQSVFIKTYFSGINAYLINLTSKIPFTLRNTLGYSKTIEHGPPHQITDGINRLSLTQKQTFHNFCSQTWLFCPLFLNLFTRILVMPNFCFTEKVNWGCSLHTKSG